MMKEAITASVQPRDSTRWPLKHYKNLSSFCDKSEQFDADKAEKLKKIKRKHDSPKTPPGSPPLPPPPPPPSGPSGASGTTGASWIPTQDPLQPPSFSITIKVIISRLRCSRARPRQCFIFIFWTGQSHL
ncbi:hypothetical protein Tco_0915499 [Tanacetum coccineum]